MQPRIEFVHDQDFTNSSFDIMPQGLHLELLNLTLLKQSAWSGFLASLQTGAQRFIDSNFGFALVDEQGNSVAQAYGAMIGNGMCEIGILTDEKYRGKGYILYPAYAIIQECYRRGLQPIWSCNTENIASWKTAFKLGFRIKRHYAFLKK